MNYKLFYLALLYIGCVSILYAKEDCKHADKDTGISRFCSKDERVPAFKRRKGAACLRTLKQKRNNVDRENKGTNKDVPFFAAHFTKSFEHDSNGILTTTGQLNYELFLKALKSGKQEDFNAISLAPGVKLKLVNPQSAFSFSLVGADSCTFKMPAFPELSNPQAAALMIEEYLAQLCRDVYFSDYGTGTNTDFNATIPGQSLTNYAASVLQALGSAYEGPRNPITGIVDSTVLFKGNSFSSTYNGSLVGPYISQFLILPVSTFLSPGIGAQTLGKQTLCPGNPNAFVEISQLRPVSSPATEFVVTLSDFVTLQNGQVPQPYNPTIDYNCNPRYMVNGRDIASYVHFETPYEEYYNTLKILFAAGFPLSPTNPYANGSAINETGFVTFGISDAFQLIGGVTNELLKATCAQKWRAFRVLRPEEFGGLVNYSKSTGTNPFHLDNSLLNSNVLPYIFAKNAVSPHGNGTGTYLLSQVYPEGCPIHPSYPQGHASIAGACITVIKAMFDDTVYLSTDPRIPTLRPMIPDPNNPAHNTLIPYTGADAAQMTLATELAKLGTNIAQGRNFAGIHYRADADQGFVFGEEVAIKYLQDHIVSYTEETFTGFELTKINGTRVRITATSVTPL